MADLPPTGQDEEPESSELDPEVIAPEDVAELDGNETIEEPAKVIRIGAMIRKLLEEVREAQLDEKSRHRMKEIYETSIRELADGLSPELRDELDRLTMKFTLDAEEPPTEGELRIAQAQLVGWLEGLFHGIQATLVAQQVAAQSQLMARPGLPLPREGEPGSNTGYL